MIDYAASRYEESSISAFRDLFIRAAHLMAANSSQEDVTIGELRKQLKEKKHLLRIVASVVRRKK